MPGTLPGSPDSPRSLTSEYGSEAEAGILISVPSSIMLGQSKQTKLYFVYWDVSIPSADVLRRRPLKWVACTLPVLVQFSFSKFPWLTNKIAAVYHGASSHTIWLLDLRQPISIPRVELSCKQPISATCFSSKKDGQIQWHTMLPSCSSIPSCCQDAQTLLEEADKVPTIVVY